MFYINIAVHFLRMTHKKGLKRIGILVFNLKKSFIVYCSQFVGIF